jgi:hypothetical protein
LDFPLRSVKSGVKELRKDNVCYWHKADMQTALTNVRFLGAKRTLTNRWLPISIYELRPCRADLDAPQPARRVVHHRGRITANSSTLMINHTISEISITRFIPSAKWSLSVRCEGKTSNRLVRFFPRDAASGRNAAIISGGLIFALSFGNPVPLGSFYCCLRSRTTADRFIVPIRNFGSIGTLPKHQFLGPSPTGARRSYFGHQRILTARCDEKIAQSTEQSGAGLCAA